LKTSFVNNFEFLYGIVARREWAVAIEGKLASTHLRSMQRLMAGKDE